MHFRTLIAALFLAVAGCQPVEETTKMEDKTTGQAKKPPHLIVGTWKRVKQIPPRNPLVPCTIQFSKDGTCTIWLDDPRHGFSTNTGSYRLQADQVFFSANPEFPDSKNVIEQLAGETFTIKQLSKERFVISGSADKQSEEYQRVQEGLAVK